ncbi:hypothetical protein CI238_05437 [Colletotrichum incanum]|uniref:Uncharacterized protein n=1 Tax=Colletotrichum incanum TaxID=1573173 RepID=A0A167AGV6_COLIC|nr:hypothetical protein CI238_05437 [Colletotrichum incanum]OHW89705.1 hypothetical protein CSPAE12_11717 [Colletotrichum incanum]
MAFRLVTLCLATAVAAAPAFVPRTINGTEFDPERGLVAGEVLLYDMDHMEVVHEEFYAAMLASEGILAKAPEVDHSLLDFEAPTEEEIKKLDARQTSCGTTTSVVITRTDRFFDWDLQMSPVVIAGANPMDISYASTFTVTDTITINGAFSPTLVKTYLTANFGISGSRSWATATAITIKGTISARHTGVMVNNPFKTRRYGRVMRGCLGSQTQIGTFMSDAYEEGSYSGVRWVRGAITPCEKPGVHRPLTRCQGSGSFI